MVPNAEQEKKERGSTNLVRDKLHHQAEYLHTPESTNVKLSARVVVWRERQTSIKVLKEEKRGLQTTVRVVLRERLIRLESVVEASRRKPES
jgi:mitotic spindle assembly checkpoint protein MAD1